MYLCCAILALRWWVNRDGSLRIFVVFVLFLIRMFVISLGKIKIIAGDREIKQLSYVINQRFKVTNFTWQVFEN